ncbi:HalD/BesD family halogenase [Rhodovibrionaceae bacterium A322]
MTAQSPDPRDYVDLARYPLADETSAGYQKLVAGTQGRLAEDGCAVLRGFIRPDCLADLVAEADGVADRGHRSFNRTNAYFTQDDPSLPVMHPLRRFYDRSNSFVPADNFGQDSVLRALYEWPAFPAFIQAALGEDRFYRYADPLADVIINQVEEGQGFPWHFDTNNFTVTLAIQNGYEGGEFEYSPNLRSSEDENYDGVAAILEGDHSRVKCLTLGPGDLQIFKGRYSLHRVKPVLGPRMRYVAIFSYVEEPGMVGSPERTRQLYGRVLPIHEERAGLRGDALVD